MGRLILLVFFLNSFMPLSAQNISAQIKDINTKKTIEYVNIGIVGKNIGTVSDSLGFFNISLINVLDIDTLKISAIGFKTKSYSIRKLRNTQFPKTIFLEEEVVQLSEVILGKKSYEAFQLGLKKKYCYPIPFYKKVSGQVVFPQNNIYHEIGTRFTNSKRIKLDSVQINFAKVNRNQIEIRLNIYQKKNNEIVNILKQPIYILLSKKEALNFPIINLEKYKIQLDSDFLITVENHKKLPNGTLSFLANTKSKGKKYPVYFRNNSQSNWVELKSKKNKTVAISMLVFF